MLCLYCSLYSSARSNLDIFLPEMSRECHFRCIKRATIPSECHLFVVSKWKALHAFYDGIASIVDTRGRYETVQRRIQRKEINFFMIVVSDTVSVWARVQNETLRKDKASAYSYYPFAV